jgi:hypothetical protein
VFSTIVFMSLVASHVFLGTPLGARARAGTALGTAGVARLVSTVAEGHRWTPPGVAGMALAIAGSVLVRRQPRAKAARGNR